MSETSLQQEKSLRVNRRRSRRKNKKNGFLQQNRELVFYWLYGVFIGAAELTVALGEIKLGVFIHILILGALILHSAFTYSKGIHLIYLALVLAPLTRILSLSMPLAQIPPVYWYLVISVPLFASAIWVTRVLGFKFSEVGLNTNYLPYQILIGLIGFPLGFFEYLILQPEPMVASLTFSELWLPCLILLICTGLMEEFIFRGIMFRSALKAVGRRFALIYTSIIFALLHITHLSFEDVIFVFAVALLFTYIFMWQRTIVGITIAHGLTNITLYILCPLII